MRWASLAVVVVLLSVTVSAQTRDPVAGAWELTASKRILESTATTVQNPPLRVIYANGYYIQFTAEADRKVNTKPFAEQTKEELIDRLRMQGNYGTYQVKGNQLLRNIVAAAAPQNTGQQQSLEFRIDGDVLVTTGVNPQGVKIESHYRRLK